jgi:hypothetical protein
MGRVGRPGAAGVAGFWGPGFGSGLAAAELGAVGLGIEAGTGLVGLGTGVGVAGGVVLGLNGTALG